MAASSSLFRGRRVMDPVPVQRGSLSRKSRQKSSFTGLEAAWENVGEVRTALEAAEARIQEASAGLGHDRQDAEEFVEPMLHQVFSEKQKYGRVTRYELHPDNYRRESSPRYSDDKHSSKRSLEFQSNGSRSSSRASTISSIHNEEENSFTKSNYSPPSRDVRNISPPYINDTEAIHGSSISKQTSTSEGRLPRFSEDNVPGKVTSSRSLGLSGSTFEDSLEMSNARGKPADGRPLSSLGMKSAIDSNSDVLARLKERIKKQKDQAIAIKPTDPTPVPKTRPLSAMTVTREDAILVPKPLSKRKVAPGPAPAVYKGFSEVEPKFTSAPTRESRQSSRSHSRNSAQPYSRASRNQGHLPKAGSRKGKGSAKVQRIIAPHRPTSVISTTSWRSGQQTVNKILGPSKKPLKSSPPPQSTASQDSVSTESKASYLEWKEEEEKVDGRGPEESSLPQAAVNGDIHMADEKDVEEKEEEEQLSQHTLESDEDEDEPLDDIKSSRVLSEEARNILSDLDLDSKDSDTEDKPVTIRESKPSGKQSGQTTKKLTTGKKRKAPPSQPKQEQSYPKEKVRHYDVDKVKQYMEKQLAERKKKMRQDKEFQRKAMDERKKRLEELYNKQKKSLAVNLAHKDKDHVFGNRLGETFLKDQAEMERIGIPYGFHHPFHRDELEYHSDGTERSESDKENVDVASFKGLPSHDRHGKGRGKVYIEEYDPESLSSSLSSGANEGIGDESRSSQTDYKSERTDGSFPSPGESRQSDEEGLVVGYPGFPKELTKLQPSQSKVQAKKPLSSQGKALGVTISASNNDNAGINDGPAPTNRADRIAAIRNTASAFKQRLEQEAHRLGLSLHSSAQGGAAQPLRGEGVMQRDVFRGNLPGVDNIREQAELNEDLESMNYAATKIQAAYRGHSTRQGLNWRLPSGRTLGATIREGWRQTPVSDTQGGAAEGPSESSRYSTAMDQTDQGGDSSISDVRSGYSVGHSLQSRSFKVGDFVPQKTTGLHTAGSRPLVGSSYKVGSRTEPWAHPAGDSMSVINIFMRKNPKFQFNEEPVDDEPGSETASLLSDLGPDKSDDTASLLELEDVLEPDKDADKTIVPESPPPTGSAAGGGDAYDDDDFTLESEESHKESVMRSPSPDRSYSASFASPSRSEHRELSRSSFSLSESDTSTSEVYSAMPTASISSPPVRAPPRLPASLYQPSHQGGDRMSPGTLDNRLMAELNRLEYMEESVRQLTDIERTKQVSFAQQETVSLAQILKAKQTAHARDMDLLRIKAKQEALDAAQELEEARKAAAMASADAQHTVAMVKADAANAVTKATDGLVRAQMEAAKTTTESARQVAEAQTSAAKTLFEAANQRTEDVREVASAAAGSAAQAAVMATIEQYRKEQMSIKQSSRQKPHKSYSESYSEYSDKSPSYSRSRTTRTAESSKRSRSQLSREGEGYTSEEFESFKETDQTKSVPTASDVSLDRTSTRSKRQLSQGPTPPGSGGRGRSGADTASASIPEEVDLSVAEGSLGSENDSVKEATSLSKKKDNEGPDYSMTFEESMFSSHTATDDELDYRMILPSEGHRRRSIGQRSSVGSDAYSSDENHEPLFSDTNDKHTALFSGGEDSFSKFTADMVHLMREEEVRAKHQEALLRLREKALKEKTKAEMSWLELQKRRHRDKSADDVMPSIRKRQRGVLMRLQAGQAEIKRLKAANRAASYERKLMLMQREEIADMRRSAQDIRNKVKGAEAPSRDKKTPDATADKSTDKAAAPRGGVRVQANDSPPSKATSVPEEISAIQSPSADASFPTYDDHEATISGRDRKRSFSEGESDEGSVGDREAAGASKSSPRSSGSFGIMQRLNKRRVQSSERYLTQREQKIIGRRHKAEDLLASQRKLIEWERRLDAEESEVTNLLNQALGLQARGTRPTATARQPTTASHPAATAVDSRARSVTPVSSQSTKTKTPSENLPSSSQQRTSFERSASESSVPEDIPSMAPDRSRDSSIPEVDMKSRSQDTSIPEEYGNDTFESIDSTATPTHSTPVRKSSPVKSSVSTLSQRSEEEEMKSEEETSLTETSDYSDVESRVRMLKNQLDQRKREARRLYSERKRQRRAILRAQEASLRKELEAVEKVIQKTKAELEQPSEKSRPVETRLTTQPETTPREAITPSVALDREARLVDAQRQGLDVQRQDRDTERVPTPHSEASSRSESISRGSVDRTRPEEGSLRDRTPPSEPSSRSSSLAIRSAALAGIQVADRTPSVVDVYSSDAKESGSTDKSESSRDLLKEYKLVVNLDGSKASSPSEELVKTASDIKDLDISDRSGSASIAEELSKHRTNSSEEIEEEAKTAEDVSLSSEIKTVSRRDSGSERSRSVRSAASGIMTGTLPSSRRSPKPQEESKQNDYSYTFESEKEEYAKTEDDISEHITVDSEKEIEEELSEHLEKGDSPKEDSRVSKGDSPGAKESVGSVSEGSDDTITEDIALPEDTSQDDLQVKISDRPGSRESALSGYSEDFEPSEEEERDLKGKVSEAGLSYTNDFEASDSNGVKISSVKDRTPMVEPSSLYTPDFDLSTSSKREAKVSLREKSEEKSVKVTKVDDEIPTDEESVAEELPEEEISSRSVSEASEETPRRFEIRKSPSPEVVAPEVAVPRTPSPEEALLDALSVEPQRGSIKVEEAARVVPPCDKPEERSAKAERITNELSGMLVEEAVNCVTSIYEAHGDRGFTSGQEGARLEQRLEDEGPVSKHVKEEGATDFWPEEYGEISEVDDVSISERLSFSEDEESFPGLDFKKEDVFEKKEREKEPAPPPPMQKAKTAAATERLIGPTRSDTVVNKLSEDLLQEAVSQMIQLMRTKKEKQKLKEKQEKEKAAQELEKTPLTLHLGEKHLADRHDDHDSSSPCSSETSPRFFDKFMAVHRFPEGILKQHSPPGSPTKKEPSSLDGHELADKLSQLKMLHDELGHHLDGDDDDDDEFDSAGKELELPSDDDDGMFVRPRSLSLMYVVPHREAEATAMVESSLSRYYARKQAGLSINNVTPPSEIDLDDTEDPNVQSKRVYERLVFDLTGDVFRDLLHEESPPQRPLWMKPRPRRKNRFYHSLAPLRDESDYQPVVQRRVLNLIGLGHERPNLDTLRRKTPLKAGKKDTVDAILIQELREEEPQWIDYDDDELAVKFQVADAILDSLLSETVMVMTAVQNRKDSRVADR